MADPPLAAQATALFPLAVAGGSDSLPPLPRVPAPLAPEAAPTAFANPVAPSGADPWVIRWAGEYYYCQSKANAVRIARAQSLPDVARAPAAVVWAPRRGAPWSRELWAPELHRLDGRFYVYVAASDGRNRNHRMYVLEGDALDPQRPFRLKGRIADPAEDRWAIDGTVLAMDDGRRYFVWSGWEGAANGCQSLYVAPMANPWTIGARVRISTPEHPWERNTRPLVNEGPAVLRGPTGRVFVVYSAGGSWTDDYCLGLLSLEGDDPLRPSAWAKRREPVFTRTRQVAGPGHCSFVKSPDGSEDWIVYHAARHEGAGWKRDVRMQRFGWSASGEPEFGIPVAPGQELALPSGSSPGQAGPGLG